MKNRVGFVIDIDGTLTHSGKAIPRARQTLELMRQQDMPFILLTNNSAPSEQWKADEVTQRLGLE
jgi:4-nitrophenyl phosphatase